MQQVQLTDLKKRITFSANINEFCIPKGDSEKSNNYNFGVMENMGYRLGI
jgi:hypothetical protein